MNNGIDRLVNQMMQAPQKAEAQVNISQPINDVQLLCLVAAALPGSACERAELAMEIVAEVVVRVDGLKDLIQQKQVAKTLIQ